MVAIPPTHVVITSEPQPDFQMKLYGLQSDLDQTGQFVFKKHKVDHIKYYLRTF